MRRYDISFTRRFQRDYAILPRKIQERADQQMRRLSRGEFSYPSLRARKMEGEEQVWEASVTMNYRLVFLLDETHIIFLKIGTHDVL